MFFKSRAKNNFSAADQSRFYRPGTLVFSILMALWWTIVFDIPYWNQLSQSIPFSQWSVYIGFGGVLFFIGLSLILLLSFLPRFLFKLVMIVLTLIGATAFCGSFYYGAVISPDMMRNVLATSTSESMAYLSLRTTIGYLFVALPPLFLIFWMGPKRRSMRWGWLIKAGGVLLSLILGIACVAANFQALAGINRSDHTLRYYIAPVNVIWSTAKTYVSDDSPDAIKVREVIDPSPEMTVKPKEPVLFVVLVGETARRFNWGLDGYARDTTPQLRALNVINFTDMTSCGTSTDISVPCMMSRVGRFNYDRKRIISEETLPTLLKQAGFNVIWVDNQGGCKGACTEVTSLRPEFDPKYCEKGGDCLDGVFFKNVKDVLANLTPDKPTVLFLHMMGSHGPKYYVRSTDEIKQFKPECRDADLASCSKPSIVNAYDNSILYTDYVLSEIIRELKADPKVASGLIFMSDHGESLGENGLYLHGAPWLVAPKEQYSIPGILWLSDSFVKAYDVNMPALEAASTKPSSHDNLFSTMLGLLKVKSSVYDPSLDLSHPKAP